MSKRETKKADAKRPKGRPKNKPTATNANEYMQLKKPFTHQEQTVNPQNIAKIPQILWDLGKYEQAQGRMKQIDYQALLRQIHQVDKSVSAYEADAGIQGLKGTVRRERNMDLLIPRDQLQMLFKHNNWYQPSQRGPSNIGPSTPDHSIEDSDDERMELFGGYNRYQIQPQQELNPYSQNTDQQTDFAQQVDATQEDAEDEKEEAIEEQELEEDNEETNRELEYIGG
ncbi:MAG: hypothetical protein EZS28_040074, partial [Streblomastix strix]